MTPKGYTTEEIVENYILQDIDPTYSTTIDDIIAGVEKTIDMLTGRNFIADTEASARLYDGDGSQELLIDDAIEITTVEVGTDSYGGTFQEVSASGSDRYFKYPINASERGVPITKIMLSAHRFAEGNQNNRITAKWGYSETCPADIQFVATVFVAGILNQQRQGGDQIKSEKIGNYQVTFNTDNGNDSWGDFERAKDILDSYAKLNI
jgi:hypothetical protein